MEERIEGRTKKFEKKKGARKTGWKKGLKTGCYYIRNQPRAQTQKFTIDSAIMEKSKYLQCESCSG